MIGLAIFALVVLIIIKLRVNKTFLVSPSIVIGLLFILSLSVLLCVFDDWDVSISASVLMLIILVFLALSISEIITISVFNRFGKGRAIGDGRAEVIRLSNRTIVYQSMILLAMLLYVFYQVKIIASTGGAGSGSFDQMLQAARNAIISDGAGLDFFGAIFNSVAQGFYFAYIYIFINNFTLTNSLKQNARYLFIPFIFCLFAILSTTRTVFAMMIFYFLGVYVLLKIRQLTNDHVGIIKKIAKPIFVIAIVFVVMFEAMGMVRGSVQQFSSPIQSIEMYIASPIVALNRSMTDESVTYNRDFGACTLSGYAEKFGKTLRGCDNGFVQYDFSPDYGQFAYTNVYTGIKPYVKDYGILGLFIVMLFIGALYAFVLAKSLRANNNDSIKWIIIYSIMLYAPFMFIFDDQFTELFVNITIWISCIVGVIVVNNSKNNVKFLGFKYGKSK